MSVIIFFNTSMLGLVTSSNLIQIYFFWELVGMCSYLLIGFWGFCFFWITGSLEFRDLFKIDNNWIPNNGINSLLTTFFISLIGTITLFLGATLALAQRDIKRSLAYSTMSQLGYMMLALGIGSYQAALFHLITHAYSKALFQNMKLLFYVVHFLFLVVFTLFWNNSLFYCRINCILLCFGYIYLLLMGICVFIFKITVVLKKVRCIQYPYVEKLTILSKKILILP
ncbi:hypothetical protein ACJX0J_005225 [Zea mays]